jgi:hypothetical protein
MATIAFVTPEELAERDRKIDRLEKLLEAHILHNPQWLRTNDALEAAGVRSRQTLVQYARASAPNKQEPGRITYRKEGVICFYLKSSCIDYSLRKLGQPTLSR